VEEINKTKRKKKTRLPQPTSQPNLRTQQQQQPQRPISLTSFFFLCSRRAAAAVRQAGRARSLEAGEGITFGRGGSLGRPPSPSLASPRAAAPASVACFRSSLSLSLPFLHLSLCPLISRRRWGREPCAGAGGGRGAAGGGARRGRRVEVEERRAGSLPATKGYAFLFPSCCG
jgi:hypothetical protein